MVTELLHRHVGEQPRRGQALLNHLRRHRCGFDLRFAGAASVFLAPVLQHAHARRLDVELLGDFLADHMARSAAAGAGLLLGREIDFDDRTWQIIRQGPAHRFRSLVRGHQHRRYPGSFGDGHFLERPQPQLRQRLRGDAELAARKLRQLIAQLLDQGFEVDNGRFEFGVLSPKKREFRSDVRHSAHDSEPRAAIRALRNIHRKIIGALLRLIHTLHVDSPQPRYAQIDSLKQQRELRQSDPPSHTRPPKVASLQAFIRQPKAVPVVPQQFDFVARTVAENKNFTRHRLAMQ